MQLTDTLSVKINRDIYIKYHGIAKKPTKQSTGCKGF